MSPAVPAVLGLFALALTGCSEQARTTPSPPPAGYSADVRENFLASCVDNAARTAGDAADEEQLSRTCECILGKVEQEYSEAEFAQFEQRLLGDTASDEETRRLTQWSTSCAQEAAD